MAATCVFPVSQSEIRDRSMGLRHRAAIGLSEETDAIVVIVSEETGDISYCHAGALHSNVSVKQLKNFLTEKLKVHTAPVEKLTFTARVKDSLRDLGKIINKKLRPKDHA